MDERFTPGTLWGLLTQRTAAALRSGSVQPMRTRSVRLQDGQVSFTVRILDSEMGILFEAIRCDTAVNPFLPYDADLFVAPVSTTHVALLNKFPVVPNHLLVITRCFEEQESGLTPADFDALARCMTELDGLAFFNSGAVSGASQRHKHLQVVPLPLASGEVPGPPVPIEAAFGTLAPGPQPCRLPALPFAHALLGLEALGGPALQEACTRLWRALGLDAAQPHNLLLTRRWMLLVGRSCERFEGMPVNALGFAGSMLVRHPDGLERVRQVGPLRVLRQVGLPP
ncbi:MAG: DUF4922 domain-containing protein [Candidatus Latescibacterota bacterium]